MRLAYRPLGRGCGTFRRDVAVSFGVLVLLLNVLGGALSHSHFGSGNGLALSQDGSKMAVCAGGEMLLVDQDGNIVPGQPSDSQHNHHDCSCCLLMQASAVLPPPAAAPAPAATSSVQIMRPGAAQHLHATAVPTRRNRGPPSQA